VDRDVGSVQLGAAIAKGLFDALGPGGTVFLRIIFAALLLIVLWRPRLRGYPRSGYLVAILFGLVLAGMNFSIYQSFDRIPLGIAVTIEFIGPLGVAVAGSRRLLDLLWVALAAAGILLLVPLGILGSVDLDPVGVVFAVLAGCLWAAYILLSQRVGSSFAGLDGLALALALGTLVMVPAGVAQGGSALLQPELLLGGLGVAVLSSLVPYSLELIALRRLAAASFGLLMSLEPAVAAVAGVLVLDQQLQLRTGVAILMVVVASAGTTVDASRSATGRGASRAASADPLPDSQAPLLG